jgi:hypothetical protein
MNKFYETTLTIDISEKKVYGLYTENRCLEKGIYISQSSVNLYHEEVSEFRFYPYNLIDGEKEYLERTALRSLLFNLIQRTLHNKRTISIVVIDTYDNEYIDVRYYGNDQSAISFRIDDFHVKSSGMTKNSGRIKKLE